MGIVWELFGNCLELSFADYQALKYKWWELFGNCLGIVWDFLLLIIKHLNIIGGNCLGIVWELFGNLRGGCGVFLSFAPQV